MHSFTGVLGFRGRTGATGDTGATGEIGVNVVRVKVETSKRRVARQVAGCPGTLPLKLCFYFYARLLRLGVTNTGRVLSRI